MTSSGVEESASHDARVDGCHLDGSLDRLDGSLDSSDGLLDSLNGYAESLANGHNRNLAESIRMGGLERVQPR